MRHFSNLTTIFCLAASRSVATWTGVALFSLGLLGAQGRDSASLFGTVWDNTGGVIPGAMATLTNVNTGFIRTGITSENGAYSFSSVPVGFYKLTVELAGFRRFERVNLRLQANDNLKVDVTLEVGELTEVVTVTAAGAQVETRSATLKQTVDSRRVVELPLNGRNAADLTLLAPGAMPAGGVSGDSGFGLGVTIPKGGKNFSINGSRQNNLLFTLDGGTHTDSYSKVNLPFPFPDAVQEFSVQTSNMEPEVGISAAGVVNVVTKSGTNNFHGNVFWFARNTALNATDFFSHEHDQLKRNQAGFTLGGPIKKDKLLFFGGFQKLVLRTAAGSTRAQTLTPAERTGDFSGHPNPIIDPLTDQAFPNNVIPEGRISPAAKKLLAWSPLPDPDGFARFTFAEPENAEQYVVRVDYNHSVNQNFLVRLFKDDQDKTGVSLGQNLHAFRRGAINKSESIMIGHNYVTPKIVVDTRLSANHIFNQGRSPFEGTIADFGVGLTPLSNDISISVSGASGFSVPMQIQFTRADEELSHDWAWTRGNHILKWGVGLNWKQYNEETRFRSSGHFSFDGSVTGFGRADFMLGEFSFFTQNNGELENRRHSLQGVYFNDTWRMTSRFTLNLGIRYEPFRFFTDTKDRNHAFHLPNYLAGIKTQQFRNAPAGLVYRGDPKPWGSGGVIGAGVTDPDLNNVAPRIGLAWDVFGDGKTSLRAGYAIFYSTPSLRSQNDANNVAPFSYSVEFNSGVLDDPFRGREQFNLFPVDEAGPDAPFADPLATIVLDQKWVLAYVQNWSLTLEREILPSTVLRAAYIGTKGTHLTGLWDQNAPIYNPSLTLAGNIATIDGRRPIQGYQSIARWMHGFNSAYQALQVTVDKRYSRGFTTSNSYTWSKGIDYYSADESASFGRASQTNPFNFFATRGPSDFHRGHRFVNSFVWDFPVVGKDGPPIIAVLASGWRATGIITAQAGAPFNIVATGNPTAGAGRAFVDLIGAGDPVLDGGRSKGEKMAAYFDSARFRNPTPGTYGTLGRNAIVGPGYANVDISLVKESALSALGEQGRWEFRFEAFNLFNATHLAQPVSGITNPNLGRIVSTAAEPRILQLGVKLFF